MLRLVKSYHVFLDLFLNIYNNLWDMMLTHQLMMANFSLRMCLTGTNSADVFTEEDITSLITLKLTKSFEV